MFVRLLQVAFRVNRMLFQSLLASASLLVCSLTAFAVNEHTTTQQTYWTDNLASSSSDSYDNRESQWFTDELVESDSTQSGCCDAIPECSDGCGEYEIEPHESCVDWLLPRSNLSFPLMKDLAANRATKLPLPLGSSFIFTELDRHVAVSDVRLGLGNTPLVSVDRVDVPTTTFHASTQVSRIDLWVLPCLNAYGIIGHTRTVGDVEVTVNQFPLPSSEPVPLNIPVVLEGPTAGYGFTSALGGEGWFSTLDFNQTWTNFSKLDGSLTALVLTPRVGLIVDRPHFKGEVHVGAMWQDTAQTVSLTIDDAILGNDLHVEVDQFEPNPWNFLVGAMWALDERLQLMVEGGVGGRSYIISGVTIRY